MEECPDSKLSYGSVLSQLQNPNCRPESLGPWTISLLPCLISWSPPSALAPLHLYILSGEHPEEARELFLGNSPFYRRRATRCEPAAGR